MAFTKTYLPYSRHKYFMYYTDNLDDSLEEDLIPGFAFEIQTARMHLSVGHASVVDFIARLSCTEESAHNVTLFSTAMLALTDWIWQPSRQFIFEIDDTINFSLTLSSSNRIGLLITGWAITST